MKNINNVLVYFLSVTFCNTRVMSLTFAMPGDRLFQEVYETKIEKKKRRKSKTIMIEKNISIKTHIRKLYNSKGL